jgi:hypothetical protein
MMALFFILPPFVFGNKQEMGLTESPFNRQYGMVYN